MKPLYGHTSPETAYMVNDYPYGRDRCRIRFWLESDPKKGFRFCSQTEHPRRLVWNAPKKSTYCKLAGCMYLDDKNHCVWAGVSEYDDAEKVLDFITRFPGADMSILRTWCPLKVKYTQARSEGKIVWTINNVAKPDTEAEKERLRAELATWQACIDALNK